MIKLQPVIHETIWGGDRIKALLEGYSDIPKHVGHLYLINGHIGASNKVISGDWEGRSLREVFGICKEQWGMKDYNDFPLTIALVDAKESLSIQVHPDEETAMELEGWRIGKEESWVFLEEPKEGFIYCGCQLANKEEIEKSVRDEKMEEIIGREPVDRGDYVCVQAGMLHAMTAGSYVYEVEYGGDFTYRFYDYNRQDDDGKKRELHIAKALRAIHPEIKPKKQKSKAGEWIRENNYEIMLLSESKLYTNIGSRVECVADIDQGIGMLLFPGETIELNNHKSIIARLR